jgi:hypothetical protein
MRVHGGPHPHVAGLFPLLDPHWREKLWRAGLLLLLAPPFGWPALLGYRKELTRHLFHDLPEALPRWRGCYWRHFVEGVKAIAVILGYLLPLYAALGFVALGRGYVPGSGALLLLGVFLLLPIFSTLSLPVACGLLTWATEPAVISVGECAGLLVGYVGLVFVIPAGVVRVTATGRYRSAFALWHTLPWLVRHGRGYLRAWWYSGLISLLGHFALPFSPWGVAWAYVAIIFLFNEVSRGGGGCWGRSFSCSPWGRAAALRWRGRRAAGSPARSPRRRCTGAGAWA